MPVDRKPGSVLVGHLSSPDVAIRLKRLGRQPRAGNSLDHLLAAGRVYLSIVRHRRGLWAFTPLVSPVPSSGNEPVVSFLWHFP